MCTGRVDPATVAKAFKKGLDGLMVVGCYFGDCHYISGNVEAKAKIDMTRRLLKYIGVNENCYSKYTGPKQKNKMALPSQWEHFHWILEEIEEICEEQYPNCKLVFLQCELKESFFDGLVVGLTINHQMVLYQIAVEENCRDWANCVIHKIFTATTNKTDYGEAIKIRHKI